MYASVIISTIVLSKFSLLLFSSLSAYSLKTFPTIAFIAVAVVEGVELDPGILNSNLFPVKANGDVLFLSPASILNEGITSTSRSSLELAATGRFFPSAIFSSIVVRSSPKKIEIIAGGASCPPRR